MVTRKAALICLAAVAAIAVLQGCEDEDVARYDRNRPPETLLTVAPVTGDRIFHKFHVHWAGLDRDGVVVAYRVASLPEDAIYGGRVITEEDDITQYFVEQEQIYAVEGREFWTVTDATESLFVFRADRPNSRNHSLYVAAIDNEGKVDEIPAATNFMAVDYGIPNVEVLISSNLNPTPHVPGVKGDTLPAFNLLDPTEPVLINLSWRGSDVDGSIEQWQYRLDSGSPITVSPESSTVQYVYDPGDAEGSDVWIGFHEFRLVGIDDAGAKSNEKIARFVIDYDPDSYIDSVWTFRTLPPIPGGGAKGPALGEKLIYPSDSIRVAFHYGRLRVKFHGSDLDGAEPDTFRWNIKGTMIQSVNPSDPTSPWVGQASGDGYVDVTPAGKPYLDTDSPLALNLRARDGLGRVDGSPDTVVFIVNYTPRIGTILHADSSGGRVGFTWTCVDPDQELDFLDVGLVRYRYKVDDGEWIQVTTKDVSGLYVTYAVVDGLAAGPHTFKLLAYNGDYIYTRSDTKQHSFVLE
jgi:hypothetical protein